jgi:hypothetical protein
VGEATERKLPGSSYKNRHKEECIVVRNFLRFRSRCEASKNKRLYVQETSPKMRLRKLFCSQPQQTGGFLYPGSILNLFRRMPSTTLLELEFRREVPCDEAQGEQFANRRLPQPFAHPPMHRRQREASPVRARGKKRPGAAQVSGVVPGCAPRPKPENCRSALPARRGDETRPSAAPAIDPSPAPFSLPHDTAPPNAGDGQTRPAPLRECFENGFAKQEGCLPSPKCTRRT